MKKIQKWIAVPAVFLLAAVLWGDVRALALEPGDTVVPGGQVVGIEMKTDGVIVSGLAGVQTEKGEVNPAQAAGILPGDRITALNGKTVTDGESFLAAAATLDGSPVAVQLVRDNEKMTVTIRPEKSTKGLWQLGLWLRDCVAGIGTVTYWDPADGSYGALGHGVCLPEGGTLMVISGGVISRATVGQVVPGTRGTPGELCGIPQPDQIVGTIEKNCFCGIFGTATHPLSTAKAVTVAAESEISLGHAQILSTVDPDGPRPYDIEITRITRDGSGSRQLTITVTDPRLISITGGIVQGMSGSPIIQDGKLVGAVTHVLVNDPTKGYGIFIENMLDAAG